ncbi:MAG: RNA 2',3'-cyclic phosphodiesterase [Candidatus Paceibacterota bacterium]
MSQRLFWAILLNEDLKKEILFYREQIKKLDRRNILKEAGEPHITVLFLGSQPEGKLKELIETGETIKKEFSSFEIYFNELEYGPSIPYRLIWLKGENNKNLELLKEKLEKSLLERNINFPQEKRKIIPHITLFRIKKDFFFSKPKNKRIEKIIPLKNIKKPQFSLKVNCFYLMRSILKSEGAHYFPIKEFCFNKLNGTS